MNLQTRHVLSDMTGLSGMSIIEAIVAGQRDPIQLAVLCHQKVRSSRETVIKPLPGNYRSEHLFTLKQSLASYRQYQQLMADCDRGIERLMRLLDGKTDAPQNPVPEPDPSFSKRRKNQFHFDMSPELKRIFGVDLTAIPGISALTAHTLLAEIGSDLSRLPNVAAFASWLALCPANNKSGGKVLSSKTRLLTTGQAYDESVFLKEDQKQAQRHEKRLRKQAKTLGFQLVPIAA